jgi:hypothetical protein
MSKEVWFGLIVAVCLVGGLVAYRYLGHQPQAEAVTTTPVSSAPADAAPKIQYPVPAATADAAEPPLPAINDSDATMQAELSKLFATPPVESLLIPKHIVQNFVATVNSLDGQLVPLRLWPLVHVPKLPLVTRGLDGSVALSPDNARRYAPYIAVLNGLDVSAAVKLYLRYYPLLQQAYIELGYPDRYFNDRFIAVLDHLLATPDVTGPIRLVQPKVLYEYADAKLENRSSGQKLLIRMGTDNAAVVKAKLKELRDALVQVSLSGSKSE